MLLLLITLSWRLQRNGHEALGGAVLGVATALKLFPGFLFVFYLARRSWKALFAGGAVLVGLHLLAWFVLGGQAFDDYAHVVLPAVTGFRGAWTNASMPGFWAKLLNSPNPGVVSLWQAPVLAAVATALSFMALVAVAGWKSWRAKTTEQRDRAFAVCVVAMLLASPITWHHYFVMLTLPLLILWRDMPARFAHRAGAGADCAAGCKPLVDHGRRRARRR